MKKFVIGIIVAFCFFSIANATHNGEEGIIEQLLDLSHGPEDYDLQLANLDKIYFIDPQTNEMFAQMENVNELLKSQIIRKYRAGELDHNKTSAIVSAHKKFIYHTNKLFYYISLKEQRLDYGDLDTAILKSYKQARVYYKKVKYLSLKK